MVRRSVFVFVLVVLSACATTQDRGLTRDRAVRIADAKARSLGYFPFRMNLTAERSEGTDGMTYWSVCYSPRPGYDSGDVCISVDDSGAAIDSNARRK